MTDRFYPEALFEAGFLDLVSVVPPGAQLTPLSKLAPGSLGKAPGIRHSSGLWSGYGWQKSQHTIKDVRSWALTGANVGMKAEHFPAVDIDCTDESLSGIIRDCALSTLGPAPIRYGRRPKQLLVYRTDEPFDRMRLIIERGGEQHLVEILGAGQQYLVYGTHPTTLRPYEWTSDLRATGPAGLSTLTREKADHFLSELAGILDMIGAYSVRRVGDGRLSERSSATDQAGLQAPSMELLAEAVALIPNTDALFPTRDEYVRMGYAIRAAGGDGAYEIFAGWAGSRKADGRVAGNPDTWLSDWRRIEPPFSVGWNFIADLARGFGFDTAALEFDVLADQPKDDDGPVEAPAYSDQWIADRVIAARSDELRFIPLSGTWIVWDTARWQPDAELLAEDIIYQELRRIAAKLSVQGSTLKEIKDNTAQAVALCSAGKASAVRSVMQSNRAVAVSMTALDHNPWILNTPVGIVDLVSGALLPPDPDALCTKSTSVGPAFGAKHPEWDRFLDEATGGDAELKKHMQRVAGYCLTGSTREQNLTFIYGPAGSGKGTFVNVLNGILRDYWTNASMDTFTASQSEKHSTEIAMLSGARLVTASETEAGKRWDAQKVKSLTGGDPITARFMRQDNFVYTPQFKLVFTGNFKPELRDVDSGMRRRIQMVPFNFKAKVRDNLLNVKLREEWPAILAWMIEGCLMWQRDGLPLPAVVEDLTNEYFNAEDALGRWISECCTIEPEGKSLISDLYLSWRMWSNQNGEYTGSLKRLSAALATRQLEKWKEPTTRKAGFSGITINRQDFEPIN